MRFRWLWFSVLAFAVTVAPAAARAGTRDAAKQAELRRLFKATQVEDKGRELMEKVVDTMSERLSAEDLRDLRKAMDSEVRYGDLVDALIDVYDRHFTSEEIHGLVGFFESPLGQKYTQALSWISQESDEVVKRWANATSGRVLKRFVAARKSREGSSARMPASQ